MKTKAIIMSVMMAIFGISVSFAQNRFQETRPRRAEVNERLRNQDRRINSEVRHGEISRRQAADLHRKDRSIRREEHRMAARHNGHLTRHEDARINRQENRLSRKIGY